jgi:glycosyltransferase involved in cell wall biosynthesis
MFATMKELPRPTHPERPFRPGRILIVEEALHSMKGHWFEYIKTIAAACREKGDEVSIIAHQAADPRIIEDLQAHPLLTHSAWDRTLDSPNPLKRYFSVVLHNWRLYRSVDLILALEPKADCVLAPTILIHHLLAWTLLARQYRRRKYKRLVLFFVNGQGTYRGPAQPPRFPRNPKTALFRFLLRRLKPLVESGDVVLAAETEGMADEYFSFCGVPFRCLPHPIHFDHLENATDPGRFPAEPGTLTFGCFGFARHEKGSDLLQEAILLIRQRQPTVRIRFLIQWLDDFRAPDGTLVTRHPALLRDPDVEYITRSLTGSEYTQLLDRIDAMVLPYRAASYYARVSRVAIEAASMGIPLVYTRHTWLEELVTEFGSGAGFQNEDIEGLVDAILQVATQIDFFQNRARNRRVLVRQHYCPEHFRAWMLGELSAVIRTRVDSNTE